MDETLKRLRTAAAAHHDAQNGGGPADDRRIGGAGCDGETPVVPAAEDPPLRTDGARSAGMPRSEQFALFSAPPAAECAGETAGAGVADAGLDRETLALIDAYERGEWPIPSIPAPAPAAEPRKEAPPSADAGAGRARSRHRRSGDRAKTDGAKTDGATAANTGRAANLTEGHRERLRKRFMQGDELPDYELLELLLFRALPRRDTKPIAKALIARFGTFAAAVAAPVERLTEVDGVGPAVVTDFRLVRAAAQRFAFDDLAKRPLLSSTDAVVRYYRAQLRTRDREEFHAMFVDKKHRLLASECLGIGTVDHAPVYPRELLKRALALSASGVILIHNHPSGDPAPSRADVAMTQKIKDAAAPLSIDIHDHLIVAADGYTSLRAEALM